MATWTTPKTYTAELATSSDRNTYERDNMNVGRGYVKTSRTAGNITLSSTTWANVDTGTNMTLPAATNDVVWVTIDAALGIVAGAQILMDCRSSAGSNYWGSAVETNTGGGINAWAGGNSPGNDRSGSRFARTLVSGDISGGNVVVIVRYRLTAAVNQTLAGASAQPFYCFAENRGPAVNV